MKSGCIVFTSTAFKKNYSSKVTKNESNLKLQLFAKTEQEYFDIKTN